VRSTRQDALRWGNLFLLLHVGLNALISGLYLAPLPTDPVALLFRVLIVPSHFLLLSIPLAVPGAALLWFRPTRTTRYLLVALAAASTLVIALDTQIFRLYRFHLNAMVWNLLTSGAAREILPLSARTIWIGLGSAMALITIVGSLAYIAGRAANRIPLRIAPVFAAALLGSAVLGQAIHVWADAAAYGAVTRQARHLPWLRPATAYSLLDRLGWLPADSRPRFALGEAGKSALVYPLRPMHCEPPSPAPNIVMVVIEEWRFDEYDERTTPGIRAFGRTNLNFLNHRSSGASSRYGIFGLFYGLHGSYWDSMLAEQRGPVLIDELRKAGYRFQIHPSAPVDHPEFDRTVFIRIHDELPDATPGRGASERDRRITDDFIRFVEVDRLAEPERPFFALLFYDSPHSLDHPETWEPPHQPSTTTRHHLELGRDTDPTPLRNRHRNSVHYVDSLVRRALDSLEQQRLLESTIVMITGDHGEEFNDTGQGYWGHNGNFSRFQTQVPLVVHLPRQRALESHDLTSHVDIAPTLLETALGCANPPEDSSNGRHLLDRSKRSHVVSTGRHLGIGIIGETQTLQLPPWGAPSVHDAAHRTIPSAEIDRRLVARVFSENRRFYR